MLKKVVFLCIIVLFKFSTGFSNSDYLIDLTNIEKVNSSTIEFDVFIKAQITQFELTSYQCVFSFNKDISNTSGFAFSYIEGSSQLADIPPSVGIGVHNSDGEYKLTFASMPGSENISLESLRIGRFRLTTTGSFNDLPPDIKWCLDGKINTILTGSNFDEITDSTNHSEENFGQLRIFNVIASETSDSLTAPEKTIDGKGANDDDPYSRWAARPMPEDLIFDLGSIVNVSQTKFSFYEWNNSRIYKYSILTSEDLTNWNEVVTDDSSVLSEWTLNTIGKKARYVKLIFLSNNQCNWAGLWEAQIYGSSDTDGTTNQNVETKPLINIPLSISDGIGDLDTLFVGIDSTACDGLDSSLGEVQFPTPPNGVFSAWLNIPNSQVSSLKDYRYGCKLQNYEYTYQIQYQKGSANKVIIHWNLPIAAKLKIKDIITGEIIDTVFNYGIDSVTINDPNDIYKLNFTVTYLSRPLPVELTSFSGGVIKNTVELKWKTATELNNRGFEIERKIPNQVDWVKVGFINGNGTSTNPAEYKFIDDFNQQTVNGNISYRLKLINFDGSSTYSSIIEVKVDLTPKDYVLYQNYPNPFNPTTDIKYALPLSSNVNITIYNALGERIKEFEQGIKLAGTHDIIWQAGDMASGVYFYTISAKSADGKNNFRKTQKMMLLK